MESSVQKAYERIENEDGTIDLKFEGKRFGQNAAASGFILALVMFPVSCTVTSPIVAIPKNPPAGIVIVWFVVAFMLWYLVMLWISTTSHTIKLRPGVGLECDSVRLPFQEISFLGTMTDHKTSYIYATSHGTEVRLGKYLTPALADSIVKEIKSVSGTTWN